MTTEGLSTLNIFITLSFGKDGSIKTYTIPKNVVRTLTLLLPYTTTGFLLTSYSDKNVPILFAFITSSLYVISELLSFTAVLSG